MYIFHTYAERRKIKLYFYLYEVLILQLYALIVAGVLGHSSTPYRNVSFHSIPGSHLCFHGQPNYSMAKRLEHLTWNDSPFSFTPPACIVVLRATLSHKTEQALFVSDGEVTRSGVNAPVSVSLLSIARGIFCALFYHPEQCRQRPIVPLLVGSPNWLYSCNVVSANGDGFPGVCCSCKTNWPGNSAPPALAVDATRVTKLEPC